MEVLLLFIGIALVVGLIATPIMLMCALGGLRSVSEKIDSLNCLVLKLKGSGYAVPPPPAVEPSRDDVPPPPAVEPSREVVPPPPAVEPSREVVPPPPAVEPSREIVPPPPAVEPGREAVPPRPVVEPKQSDEAPAPLFVELLLAKFADWLAVRGDFAPKGVTREFAVATRWLVRVGMMLLVGSIIYFVKLSIDNGWMGPSARVMGTLFWGATALAGGVELVKRTRYGLLGHALAALGIVALYLGFGLGHRYFDPPVIASWQLAFCALVGVTVAAGWVSILLPSSTLAVMGLVGGYLVPVVAGRDTGSAVGLCAYLLVLNVGASVVAQVRRWQGLNFLASMLAYGMVFAWCGRHPLLSWLTDGFNAVTLLVFLSAIHALHLACAVRMAKVVGKAGQAFSWMGIALNALFYLSWLGLDLRGVTSDEVTGIVFLMVVAAYIFLALKSLREGWMDKVSVNLLLVFALVFLSLAPLLLFTIPWCTMAWSLIAVACVEVYHREGNKVLGVMAGLLLCAASLAGLIFGIDAYGTMVDAGWGSGGPFVCRIVRLGTVPVAVFWVARRLKCLPLVVTACLMGWLYFTGEAHRLGSDYLPMLGGGTVTLAWALMALSCLAGGIVKRLKPARLVGLTLLGVAAVKLLLFDTAPLAVPARVGVFAGVGVLMMVGAFFYLKFKAVFEGGNENE